MKYQVFLYIIIVILIILNINSIYLLLTTKRKYTTKFIEDKAEQFKNKNKSHITLLLYTKQNCGLCKKIKSIYDKIYDDYKECDVKLNGCRIQDKLVTLKHINCDDEEHSCYNIPSYPSFVLDYNDTIINYNGNYNLANFDLVMQWLKDELIKITKKKEKK